MPEEEEEKIRISSVILSNTLSFLVEFKFEGNPCLVLIDVPSVRSGVMCDVETVTKSSGCEALLSLLVELSFKLRRRVGFLRIRLGEKDGGEKRRKMFVTENSIFVY